MQEAARKALQSIWHHNDFRGNQWPAIHEQLLGKDVVLLMRTGGGKTLTYQLPMLTRYPGIPQGVTVVISPLISLMADQVTRLKALGVQAYQYSSHQTQAECTEMMNAAFEGCTNIFVYITPERIAIEMQPGRFFDKLQRRKRLGRVVIDEAHVISEWGHDFRPDYRKLSKFRDMFPDTPITAVTATATQECLDDMIECLQMREPILFRETFDRPNLHLSVRVKRGNDLEQTLRILQAERFAGKSIIVYCMSRKDTERVAGYLQGGELRASAYHAGMHVNDRTRVQVRWMSGATQIIVATTAFGMGIDKPDVRLVLHHSMPTSLEAYYQQIGRAGRDGQRSECIMLYDYRQAATLRTLIESAGHGVLTPQIRYRLRAFEEMQLYAQDYETCKRVMLLKYFDEEYPLTKCGNMCNRCSGYMRERRVDIDVAQLARDLFTEARQYLDRNRNVTAAQLEMHYYGLPTRLKFADGFCNGLFRLKRVTHRLIRRTIYLMIERGLFQTRLHQIHRRSRVCRHLIPNLSREADLENPDGLYLVDKATHEHAAA